MDWEREFMPWLASLPEDDQLELMDLLLQLMAAKLDRRFQGPGFPTAMPALPGMNVALLN